MHLVQRDLSDLGLAGFDVGSQQHGGLFAPVGQYGLEDLGVLVVRGIDARLLGEVEAPNDPNTLGHVAVHTRHFSIASGGDK